MSSNAVSSNQGSSTRSVRSVTGHARIDGVVPGVRGQRSLPTRELGIVDPFVMLDHIGPDRLADDFYVNGDMHPHRGFETLTMMFEGTMFHVDSAGFTETLPSGSTQNMVAGSGIQHGGDMAADSDTHVFHEVQLWVNMPAATKMNPPAITSVHAGDKPIIDRGHYTIEVITGTIDGQTSPLTTTQPTTVARIQTTGSGSIVIDDVDPNWNAVAYVLQGSIDVASQNVDEHGTVLFNNDGATIELTSTGPDADILLITGQPIGEPVAMGGPFVMSTQQEIAQAQADFDAGLFDNVVLADASR
ncbi:MAG: pirin family protein [Acidimicrobiales bacterium]